LMLRPAARLFFHAVRWLIGLGTGRMFLVISLNSHSGIDDLLFPTIQDLLINPSMLVSFGKRVPRRPWNVRWSAPANPLPF